ncbi:hypothetical protein LTR84_001927 [Exophiala bonariae]|uniref:Uncharacterized protein n=1 Tax=Exophiala bonariae TaxID=1690606 RepID=A0AAV9NBR2_9EURO|nr:hypothetical protein LTR84_001927 [Exophiala bonariae]
MPMVWNSDADARLFAAVLATSDVKVNYAAVAAMMGNDCTAKAVTHRIGNIKKVAGSTITNDGDASATGTPKTTTPKGRKRATKTNDDSTPSKKSKVAATTTPKPTKKDAPSTPAVVKEEKAEDTDTEDTKDGSITTPNGDNA